MTNPYASPAETPEANPYNEVYAPAVALIVVSTIGIVMGLVSEAMDIFLLLSGMVAELEAMDDEMISEYMFLAIRMVWGVILIIASAFVLNGGARMKALTNYRSAQVAAIVALVPCVGPCCFLGIPVGLWALLVLRKPTVRSAFTS